MRRKRALKVVLVVVGVIFCGLASLNYDVCEARACVGDETGAPVGVQQKLMRNAHVSTTMDQYGNASALAKRKANRPIVQRLLRSLPLSRSPFNK